MADYGSTNIVTVIGGGSGADKVWAEPINGEEYVKCEKGFLEFKTISEEAIVNTNNATIGILPLFLNNTQISSCYHRGYDDSVEVTSQGYAIWKADTVERVQGTAVEYWMANVRCTSDGLWIAGRMYNVDSAFLAPTPYKFVGSTRYVYLGDGYTFDNTNKEIGKYDFITNTFNSISNVTSNIPTYNGVHAKVGNYIVLSGKNNGNYSTQYAEVFDISDINNPVLTHRLTTSEKYMLSMSGKKLLFYLLGVVKINYDGQFFACYPTSSYLIRKVNEAGLLENVNIPEELAPYCIGHRWVYNTRNGILTCAGNNGSYAIFKVDEEAETFTKLNIELDTSGMGNLIILSMSDDLRYAVATGTNSTSENYNANYWRVFKLATDAKGLYTYKTVDNRTNAVLTGKATGEKNDKGEYEFETVLMDTVNVTLTVNPDVADDEFKVIKVDVQ